MDVFLLYFFWTFLLVCTWPCIFLALPTWCDHNGLVCACAFLQLPPPLACPPFACLLSSLTVPAGPLTHSFLEQCVESQLKAACNAGGDKKLVKHLTKLVLSRECYATCWGCACSACRRTLDLRRTSLLSSLVVATRLVGQRGGAGVPCSSLLRLSPLLASAQPPNMCSILAQGSCVPGSKKALSPPQPSSFAPYSGFWPCCCRSGPAASADCRPPAAVHSGRAAGSGAGACGAAAEAAGCFQVCLACRCKITARHGICNAVGRGDCNAVLWRAQQPPAGARSSSRPLSGLGVLLPHVS